MSLHYSKPSMDLRTSYGLILLWLIIPIFTCFNLEPRAAIVFSKPKFPSDSNRQSGVAGRQINLENGRPSYFGFSVALLKSHADNKASLLVGAPRANSSMYPHGQIQEPGAFFKCDVTQKSCQEVLIDPDGNSGPNNGFSRYTDYKNKGWLGSALDSQPDGRQATAVCASRLKNSYHKLDITGKCYWFNSSLNHDDRGHELSPLTDYNKRTFLLSRTWDGQEWINKYAYHHAQGQAGMAVHFPDHVNDDEILIGAPGVLNWQGTVLRYKDHVNIEGPTGNRRKRQTFNDENNMFSNQFIPNPYYTPTQISDFDYFGYSVTSGKLDGASVCYVGGSPRGSDQHGKVLIFKYPYNLVESVELNILDSFNGKQLGEYFGGSVAMLDANGDGADELVVGAPLHALSNKADVGKFYYYRNIDHKLELSTLEFVGSGSAHSRFATTLTVLGDLNKDGYEDLAVGAPYEDAGVGAVYIYMGSQNGLRPSPSSFQRLSPDQFERTDLRGFGMSLSRGVDVDENHYQDLGIGSFVSGHAVLIRSRPTARVTAILKATPDKIELEATALKLKACLMCSVQHSTKNIKLNVTLSLDHKFHTPRAHFKDGTSSITFELTVLTAAENQQECKDFNVTLSNLRMDPYQALQMRMEYSLIENDYNLPDQAEELISDPIIDRSDGDQKNLAVGIVTGCEKDGDDTCSTDLRVDSFFKNHGIFTPFTVGSKESLPLIINVTNLGEPAFLPNLEVSVDEPLKLYLPRTHVCERPGEYDGRKLYCKLNNPLNKKDDLSVNVDVSGLTDQKSSVSVDVKASSEGVETSPENASKKVKLQLHGENSLKIHGNSRGEKLLYSICDSGKVNTTTDLEVKHIIQIQKKGATPISKVDINIEIPTNISNIDLNNNFLQMVIEKAKLGNQEIICTTNGIVAAKFEEDYTSLINAPGIPTDGNYTDGNYTKSGHNRTRRETKKRYRAALKSEVKDAVQSDDPSLALNCDKVGIRCGRISCPVGPWHRDSDYVLIELRIKLNITVLAQHMPAGKGAVLMSHARAVIRRNSLNITGQKDVEHSIKTVIQPLIAEPLGIPWWYILLAILAGVLLLGLLTYALYKSGFFKRAKKEEMEGMRATVSTNDKTNLVEN